MSRTTTLRITATMARTAGKDDNDRKDKTVRITATTARMTGEDGEDNRQG
jgi:hypothetical protein